jgi:hypothetical protein
VALTTIEPARVTIMADACTTENIRTCKLSCEIPAEIREVVFSILQCTAEDAAVEAATAVRLQQDHDVLPDGTDYLDVIDAQIDAERRLEAAVGNLKTAIRQGLVAIG